MNLFIVAQDTPENVRIISRLARYPNFAIHWSSDAKEASKALQHLDVTSLVLLNPERETDPVVSLLAQLHSTNFPIYVLNDSLPEGQEQDPTCVHVALQPEHTLPQRLHASLKEQFDTTTSKMRSSPQLFESMLELAPFLMTEFDLDTLLQQITDEAVKLLPEAEAGSLLLLDDEDKFTFRAVSGYGERLKAIRFPGSISFRPILEQGRIVQISKILDKQTWQLSPSAEKILEADGRVHEIEDTLAAPLIREGTLIGYMTVDSFTPGASFTAADRQALRYLALLATGAIHNAQLYTAERESRLLARTLSDLGTTLISTLDIEQVLDELLTTAADMIDNYDALYVMLAHGDEIRVTRWHGRPPASENPDNHHSHSLQGTPHLRTAAKERRTVYVADSSRHPACQPHAEAQWPRSLITTPLFVQEELIGFLCAVSAESEAEHLQAQETLESLAPLAAIALHNAQQYHEAEERAQHLEILQKVNMALHRLRTPAAILQQAVEHALRLTSAGGAMFLRYDPRRKVLRQRESAGGAASQQRREIPINAGASGRAWAQQKTVLVQDYRSWPHRADAFNETPHAVLALPITWERKRIGVLTVFSDAPAFRFSDSERRLLELLVEQISVHIYRTTLFRALRRDRDRLAALAEIDQQIIAISETSEKTFDAILRYALKLLEVPKGWVMLDRATPNTVPVFHALGLEMPQAVEGAYQTHWPTLKRRLQQTGSDGYLARRSQDNVPDALKAAYDHEKIASTLTLPLWIRSRLTGILVLVSTRPHRWTAEEINLAQMLARQASIALEKAQMAQANQQRLEDTERLNRILTTANRQLRRADILTSICDEIRKLLDVPAVAAGLQQTEGLDITTCCTDTVKAETSRQLIPDLATAPQLEEALEKQLTLTFTDIQQEAPDIAAQLPDTLARGIVFLPIIHRSSSIGLIVAAAPTPRTFTLREVTLLESIAAAIAPALDNARLLQEAQAARKETQKAYEDLRELDDMKTQFIQNVSHELRTPLAIVKGYADLILSDHFDRDNQEVLDQALVAIQAHTNQLTALVEAITTLEDVDTDQMHRTPQPVLPVFLHAIQSIQQPIFRRKITLHTDLPSRLPRINLDAKQLGLAVFHLLDNAVKFNREGGQIWVSAWEEDGHVFCEIKDEGIGIEPAEQDRIFERFYQIDGTTRRKYEGMGLGLSIVKSVIEKHGGRVWVESEGLEKGAKFTFSLPVYSTAKER